VILLASFRVSAAVPSPVPRADSCAVLTELVENDDGLILRYRPSSQGEFLLAPIHPPLIAFSDPSHLEPHLWKKHASEAELSFIATVEHHR
jgi:hypothetical protein